MGDTGFWLYKETFRYQIYSALQVEEEKRLEKERKAAQKAREQAEKDAQKRIPPSEMFRSETDKYSQFDDKVIPLTVNL